MYLYACGPPLGLQPVYQFARQGKGHAVASHDRHVPAMLIKHFLNPRQRSPPRILRAPGRQAESRRIPLESPAQGISPCDPSALPISSHSRPNVLLDWSPTPRGGPNKDSRRTREGGLRGPSHAPSGFVSASVSKMSPRETRSPHSGEPGVPDVTTITRSASYAAQYQKVKDNNVVHPSCRSPYC